MGKPENDGLLTPGRARELIRERVRPLPEVELQLAEAVSCVAAEEVVAREAYPWFSFSAVDGYAVFSRDLDSAAEGAPVILPVNGEIRAGDTAELRLSPGTTLKIMTGAPLPEGADAVVMKEVVSEGGGRAVFRARVAAWTAVNRAGEEIQPGTVLVRVGNRLQPPSLGLLAALGVARVRVHNRPKVAVITTGDELVPPGGKRGHGQIFDSVTPMLAAALRAWGVTELALCRCRDDEKELSEMIRSALASVDVLLTVGGVSVGDYDFTVPALAAAGIGKIFHGISQKPGMPLFFGVSDDGKCAFGLPGNPASALVCAALYVRGALEIMAGAVEPEPLPLQAVAGETLVNRTNRTQFLRVITRINLDGRLECRSAGGQGSYMLSSFARSDALAELPPGPMSVAQGELLTIYPLGW